MTVTAAKILTADTVPKYLEERWDEITKEMGTDSLSLDGVEVKAIQGGNVNYAFCIVLQDGKTIFLKQVSPHKKTGGHIGTRLYFAIVQPSSSPEIPSLLNDNRHRNSLLYLVPMVFH
jgi:5-methylthioribose kinase